MNLAAVFGFDGGNRDMIRAFVFCEKTIDLPGFF